MDQKPATQFSVGASEETASGSLAVDEVLPRGNETVLVIDDDQGVRDVLTAFLSNLGYVVLEAADLDQALRYSVQAGDRVTLAISDVMMGSDNGVDIVRRLREVRPDLPVVFMSGYTDGVVETTEHTFFVRKPFTLEGIAAITRHAIDHSAGDA